MSHASAIEKRIDALSATKRDLLAGRLEEQSRAPSPGLAEGRVKLSAFVTVTASDTSGPELTAGNLRAHLEELLPEYMVPTHFQFIDSLPRLPNGKVDQSKLLEIPQALHSKAPGSITAQSPAEQAFAKIWCDVLQVDQVAVNDNFFDLGGDSILSIVVVSKLKQNGFSITPNDIFNFPTIAELAVRCRPGEDGSNKPLSAPDATHDFQMQQDGRLELNGKSASQTVDTTQMRPFFLVHGGHQLKARLHEHLHEQQPLFIFNGHWDDANIAYNVKVEQLAEDNLLELLSIQPSGPYFLGGYSIGALIALEMAQKLLKSGESVELLCLIEPTRFPGAPSSKPGSEPANSAVPAADKPVVTPKVSAAITTHINELSGLSAAARLRYIGREFAEQYRYRFLSPIRSYLEPVGNSIKITLGVIFYKIGVKMPAGLKLSYVKNAYTHVWNNYEPRPYPGKLAILRSRGNSGPASDKSWENLAEGGLHIELFEGEHTDFQNDPSLIFQWASTLSRLLIAHQRKTGDTERDKGLSRDEIR